MTDACAICDQGWSIVAGYPFGSVDRGVEWRGKRAHATCAARRDAADLAAAREALARVREDAAAALWYEERDAEIKASNFAFAVCRALLDAEPAAPTEEPAPAPREVAPDEVCPRCGETPAAASARWARIESAPYYDPEGAPTPCDHVVAPRPEDRRR